MSSLETSLVPAFFVAASRGLLPLMVFRRSCLCVSADSARGPGMGHRATVDDIAMPVGVELLDRGRIARPARLPGVRTCAAIQLFSSAGAAFMLSGGGQNFMISITPVGCERRGHSASAEVRHSF